MCGEGKNINYARVLKKIIWIKLKTFFFFQDFKLVFYKLVSGLLKHNARNIFLVVHNTYNTHHLTAGGRSCVRTHTRARHAAPVLAVPSATDDTDRAPTAAKQSERWARPATAAAQQRTSGIASAVSHRCDAVIFLLFYSFSLSLSHSYVSHNATSSGHDRPIAVTDQKYLFFFFVRSLGPFCFCPAGGFGSFPNFRTIAFHFSSRTFFFFRKKKKK